MDLNNHLRNALPPKRMTLTPKTPQNSTNAGAVDEEVFLKAFEDTPKLNLPTLKEAEQEIRHLTTVLSDSKIDWQRRIETMRNFRGLLEVGIMDYKEISDQLKLLELPFQESVKDLRSQVVREACITISFMSEKMGVKCARFCEVLLATLLNLIPNSAKVVSSSALVCIRLILQHTRSPRLIPIVANGLNSKSKEIRKASCEFLDLIVHVWPTLVLAKQAPVISEAIRKGISDASPEARQYARKAFWGFSEHFKDQAQILLSSLDPSKQRVLFTDHPSLSNSSSTNSLSQCDSVAPPFTPRCPSNSTIRTHPVPSSNSVENLNRPPSSSSSRYRSGIPVYSSPRDTLSTQTPIRAVSAIDVSAARRARARAAIAVANAKSNLNSGEMSLTGLRCTPTSSIGRMTNMVTPNLPSSSSEKILRSRSRVSQSQPTSRSTSPNSRGHSSTDSHIRAPRRRSGIALHSRETSPSRSTTSYSTSDRLPSNSSAQKKLSAPSTRDITPQISKALSTEKILQQSREAEVAMATALKTANQSKRYSFDDRSDESETSSICSDRSFAGRTIENVNEILRKLSSSHWSDRKDGLLALQSLLRHSNRTLHIYELKRITEIFTKMLSDPHTKTFTLFLEILNELIVAYKDLLGDWLPKLLIKLFLKIGQDTLYSIQSRINETLELIRELFPFPNQLSVIIRFLSDPTSKPPLKSTLHALQYSNTLLSNMELGDWTSNSDNELDLAFRKIIAWTADPKSQELRKVSSEVLINLFNLNQSEFLSIVNVLPKVPFQDTAFQIINRERKNLSTNSLASTSETPSRLSITGLSFINNTSLTKVLEVQNQTDHDSENVENQEGSKNGHSDDVFSSLKQTTDEIQKYKFETDPDLIPPLSSDTEKASKNKDEPVARSSLQGREISSASKDSGISQIDANVRTNNPTSLSSSPIHSKRKSSSPELTSASHIPNSNEKNSLEFISLILNESLTSSKDVEVQKEALQELIAMLKDQSIDWDKHFKEALKIILDKTSSGETSSIRALSYRALREFIQAHPDRFTEYIELVILKMLEASKDKEKEVQRAGESAAASVANILPLEPCLRVLRCVILLGELPMNQAAIKMLSKIIERQSEEKIEALLADMMPPLIQAYDNPESAVRKAAVFTMVTIHARVGEKLKPYLTGLDGSKMKLLKLYIDRAKSQHSSECNSPSSPMILTI